MKYALLFICLAVLSLSCQKAIFVVYGIRKPKEKSEKQILKYIDKKGLPAESHYGLTFDGFMDKFNFSSSINDILLFNSEGTLIMSWDELTSESSDISSCKGNVRDFLSGLENLNELQKIDSIRVEQFLNQVVNLDGSNINIESTLEKDVDCYALIYWATFVGRLNKDYLNSWNEALRANSKIKTQILIINVDIRDYWDEESKNAIKDGLNAKKSQ